MPRRRLRSLATVTLVLGAALAMLAPAAPAQSPNPPDFAAKALNILPPGQYFTLFGGPHTADQVPLYDGLTPKFGSVSAADLDAFFKPAGFGLGQAVPERVETPVGRPGLRIERDSFGVPHIFGESRDDVTFGAGWVTAEDRGFLIDVLRKPARLGALDAPGIDPFATISLLKSFDPTPQTEQFLSSQRSLLEAAGAKGQQVIADIQSYADGINAFKAQSGLPFDHWGENDVLGVGALTSAVLGTGGGDEVRRSELLSALQQRLGTSAGETLWNDLREIDDPETPVTLDRSARFGDPPHHRKGNAIVDAGSLDTAAAQASAAGASPRWWASNALLLSADRSATGHPLMVAGPQVGYYHPELLMEMDLHGGGIDARGAFFPGSGPYVQLGRGSDFAWSATSSGSDIVDHYVEQLCGNDTTYLYKGECRQMTTFDAGRLGAGGGEPAREIVFHETVHGPVIGYATVDGKRVAISRKRSTRGREAVNALAFADLNSNVVHSAKSFIDAVSGIELTFNWVYEDDRDIAMFSSGRLPERRHGVDPGLPTIGTGKYEWRGFLPARKHPQEIDPRSGALLSWNNKPAPDFGASDSNWTYGSVQRVQLLQDALGGDGGQTLASVTSAMNKAATQDLRTQRVLPSIAAVLHTGSAPSARDARMLELLESWRAAGSSRLDRDNDDLIDDPGAAIMDVAWPGIADAVMSPVLGPQLDQLASLIPRDENARSLGSAYQTGWYGYVDKDLRTLLGRPVEGRFRTKFCGKGDLTSCRAALWGAIDAAGNVLQAGEGPDPASWRADASIERIFFQPGILSTTMRWTNRPTFQQVISFGNHR
jgi:acyl-homoserine lactone acylase PvdQ